jgi:hypothetical protein
MEWDRRIMMNIRFLRPALAGLLVLAAAHVASAQAVINPAYINPYSRTSLAPYINYSRGCASDYDIRNPHYDPYRPYCALAPNELEEWRKQRENERWLQRVLSVPQQFNVLRDSTTSLVAPPPP